MWEAPFGVITHHISLFFSPFSLTAASKRTGTLEGEASSELNIARVDVSSRYSYCTRWRTRPAGLFSGPGRSLHPCRFCIFVAIRTHIYTLYEPTPNKASHPLARVSAGFNLIFLLLHTRRDRGVPDPDCAVNKPAL